MKVKMDDKRLAELFASAIVADVRRVDQLAKDAIGYTPVNFKEIPVKYIGASNGIARATGNNAAWLCRCGEALPLIATLFPEKRSTKCPKCGTVFILRPGVTSVDEVTTLG